jgi:secreted trypsin-like serine protease
MKVQRTNSLTLTVLLGLASPSYFASARASSSTSTPNPNLRQPRIINGTTAEADRYNYFVSLQYYWEHWCGGSLIAADVVLTAAHCGDLTSAVIKRHDLGDISDGIAIPVEDSLPHPNYDSFTVDNDFMLLFLRDPAPQDAAFVKLNNDHKVPAAGDYVTVMGHGDTKSDDVIYE